MASQCPKCRKTLEDDSICCAEVRHTWKCQKCGKLSTGFVVPYGRCYLCGGDIQVVEAHKARDMSAMKAIEEAMKYELEMYHFYRLALARTQDAKMRQVLQELISAERDHIGLLEEKYHVHLEPEMLSLSPNAEAFLLSVIFRGVQFNDRSEDLRRIYELAIAMEKRTKTLFVERAEQLPAGMEKEVYRELAAEEEDHIVILETELVTV